MNQIKHKTIFPVFLTVFFLFAFFLISLFPYSLDDWLWGGSLGTDLLKNHFDGYNGRYAGNMLVLLLTRSKFLRNIFIAGAMVLLIKLPQIFLSSRSRVLPYAASFFLMLMSKMLLVQTVVWVSGFTNYIVPVILILVYLIMVQNIFEDEMPVYRKSAPCLALVIAFISSLFIENLNLFNLALAVLLILFTAVKFKKIFAVHIAYLIGGVLSTILMFSNSVYLSILNGTDFYRTTALDFSIKDMVVDHVRIVCYDLFYDNIALFLVLTVLTTLLAWKGLRAAQSRKKTWIGACLILHLLSTAVFLVKAILRGNFLLLGMEFFFCFVIFFYLLSMAGIILLCMEDRKLKEKLVLVMICIPIIIAPLMVVTPITPRCFFSAFYMFLILAVGIFSYLCPNPETKICKGCSLAFLAGCLAIFLIYCHVYIPIHQADVQREISVYQQIQEKKSTIQVHKLPNDTFVWFGNPSTENLVRYYKSFYDIDEDVEIQLLP